MFPVDAIFRLQNDVSLRSGQKNEESHDGKQEECEETGCGELIFWIALNTLRLLSCRNLWAQFHRSALYFSWALLMCGWLTFEAGCGSGPKTEEEHRGSGSQRGITFFSLVADGGIPWERVIVQDFGRQEGIPVQYMPTGRDTTTQQLDIVQSILHRPSSPGNLLVVDSTWPGLLADDLADLSGYFPDARADFSDVQIENDSVGKRLVAMPFIFNYSVVWYRPTLLKRYGFAKPPATWDELALMARKIQAGERKRGKEGFWGYGWVGDASEGLTCHVLEWFKSASGHNFVESDGSVWIDNPKNLEALRRAAAWVGDISPKGVTLYHESDVANLWVSGQAAFIGSWSGVFQTDMKPIGDDDLPFELCSVPAGEHGHAGVLGEMGVGIAKRSGDQTDAVKAIRYFISRTTEIDLMKKYGVIPTRADLVRQGETAKYTMLRNAYAQQSLQDITARPSTVLGAKYEAFSRDLSSSINRVLSGQAEAGPTLAALQKRTEAAVHSR